MTKLKSRLLYDLPDNLWVSILFYVKFKNTFNILIQQRIKFKLKKYLYIFPILPYHI